MNRERTDLGEISLKASVPEAHFAGEYDFVKYLLRRFIPPLRKQQERLRGKLILMKGSRPPELMKFIITLLPLRLLLMTVVTQMRIK